MSTLNKVLKGNLFLFLLVFFFSSSLLALDGDGGSKLKKEFENYMEEHKSQLTDSITYYQDLRELTRLKYEIAKEQYFENQYSKYFTKNLEHRQQTFNWQLLSTKWIFVTVIIIVLSGLFFSGIQFYHSIKKSNLKKGADSNSNQESEGQGEIEKTQIELSLKDGIKINSSIVGLIILTISVAFFYLYILYVYPINQINIDNTNFTNKEIVDHP